MADEKKSGAFTPEPTIPEPTPEPNPEPTPEPSELDGMNMEDGEDGEDPEL